MEKIRGLRIRTLNIILLVAIAAMCGLITYSNVLLQGRFDQLQEVRDAYQQCIFNARRLQDGSDNLTKQVWCFAGSGAVTYMNAYFAEVDSGRREQAVEDLQATSEQKALLANAKAYSDQLMQLEFHVMRLAAAGAGTPVSLLREEVLGVALSEGELALSPAQQMNKAREMAFGGEYRLMKNAVDDAIDRFSQQVLTDEQQKVNDCRENVENGIFFQQVLLMVTVFIVAAVAWLLHSQVMTILQRFTDSITSDQPLTGGGIYELRYLASTYNGMQRKKLSQEQALKQQAETDALTGLLNRRAFQQGAERALADEAETTAFLLLDVDHFKEVNDRYGHDAGDRALQRVAALLRRSFRSTDLTARLGGDEFAVLLTQGKAGAERVQSLVGEINRQLSDGEGGVPAISVSAGFSGAREGDSLELLYQRADHALYEMKHQGGHGCFVGE